MTGMVLQEIPSKQTYQHTWYYYKKRKSDSDGEDSDEEAKKKRLKLAKEKEEKDKSNFRDLDNMAKDPSQVNEWKVLGSKCRKTFTKEVMASTPAFNEMGIITCNKWHIQGFCFEKCKQKATHKAFSSNVHRTAYDKWVKEQKAKMP
jgi:hypothetical protein